jgi:hypothetical protein
VTSIESLSASILNVTICIHPYSTLPSYASILNVTISDADEHPTPSSPQCQKNKTIPYTIPKKQSTLRGRVAEKLGERIRCPTKRKKRDVEDKVPYTLLLFPLRGTFPVRESEK